MNRLITIKFTSLEFEKLILEKFQVEGGLEFTESCLTIIEEYQKSRKIQTRTILANHTTIKEINGINFFVIGIEDWPFPALKEVDTTIEPFSKIMKIFKENYSSTEQNKVVAFQAEGSNGSIQVTNNTGKYCLENLTVYQSMILMVFNERKSISIKEFLGKINLKREDLYTELKNLILVNHGILSKSPDVYNGC